MRRYALSLAPLVVLVAAGFARSGSTAAFDPRFANITAACTPANNPQVQPPRITMARQDSIIWREQSGRAVSWTITPKNAEDWLFDQATFTGNRGGTAVTRRPRAGALANHPYRYNVRIVCADGTAQAIDPDIIIGAAQDR